MSSFLYWVSIIVLASLLIGLSVYLILRVSLDFCVNKIKRQPESSDVEEQNRLTKYHFDKHDVEDLTRIERDFKTVMPNVTIVNEVDADDKFDIFVTFINADKIKKERDEARSTKIEVQKNTNNVFQSIDNLEFWDPQYIDLLQAIMKIENRAKQVEEEIEHFKGDISDLQYYEVNERFIRLTISLSEIYCERDDLRKRKLEVMEYIQGCKEALKNRYTRTH